jgi:hypothetical protein
MSQPQQIIFGTPNNDFSVLDNSPSPTFPTLSAGTHIGYDTVAVGRVPSGAIAQASNPIADTGSTTLDTVNDTVWADPGCATFKGNPVQGTLPTFTTVSTILNDARMGLRLLWKNPS